MQLGIGSYTYGWSIAAKKEDGIRYSMDENDLIDKAKQFGIKLLQIGDNLPLHEWTEKRLEAFEKSLEQNNFTLEIGAKGLTTDNLIRYTELCIRFNAGILRFIIDDKNYEPAVKEVVQIISANVSLLEKHNITLALENHDRLKASEYALLVKLVNNKNLGICLDTVNSIGAGESIETIIDILAPCTVNLHIKDFGIARLPHKQGFIIDGRIAGEGMLNIPSLLTRLKPYNLCYTCIAEQWVPPEKDRSATLQKEQLWAEKSINYLQKILNKDT